MYTPPFMPRTSFSIISKMSDMRIKGDLRQLQRLAAMHAEVGTGEFFQKEYYHALQWEASLRGIGNEQTKNH